LLRTQFLSQTTIYLSCDNDLRQTDGETSIEEGQEMAPEPEKSDDGQPKAASDQDAHAELR
jgi:hypothetical protein